jgi:lysophospholipase L1-like esterase
MHVVSARRFGLVAAIACIVALASAPGCSTRSADVAPVDAPRLASAGTAPSHVGTAPDAAAATIDDAGKSTDAPIDAGADADGGVSVAVAPFHIVGRIDTRDAAGPSFGWSATEIRARFSGASLSVVLQDTGASYYDVAVDGGRPTVLLVTGSAKPYELATGLALGEHDVILTRRTEAGTGVTQLLGFVGALVPTPAPSGRRIELVGDSITCGYGVLGPNETCPFSASTESEPLAWGAVAARQLAALHMVTAVSGLGVIRNYGGDTVDTMPERYDRALADDASSIWDHHAFEPDVIVVNLGTNDFAGGKGDPGPGFQVTYTSFLATLRARHPQAQIVAATSPMVSNDDRTKLHAYVAGAVATRQSAGDAKVSWVDIDEQSPADGYGCDYHPSITTQKKMAATLVAHVKLLMGW